MYGHAIIAALGVIVVLAGALLAVLFAERRRQDMQQRVAALRRGARPATVAVSVRKPQARGGSTVLSAARLARLDAAFAAAGHRIRLIHLILAGATAFLLASGFVVWILQYGAVLGVAAGAAAAAGAPVFLLKRAQKRYQGQFLEAFPDALDLIVRAVKAGLPVFEAIEVAAREIPAPVSTELKQSLDETRIGVEIETSLKRTADRIRVPDFRFFVVSLALQRRSGGSLSETLGILSKVIRQRRTARLKARALTTETKASATVISLMPVVAGLGFSIIKPDLVRLLFTDPRGRFMFGVAIITLVSGMLMMAQIIKKTLR